MNCHYSCATCSASVYYDVCLTCVSTRILTSSACPCNSAYYEYENTECSTWASLDFLDKSLINISYVAYFIAIGIQYFYIILNTNRVTSIKIKKIIDTCQIMGLISYYRYLQPALPSSGLKIMNAFNFQYLNTLGCTSTGAHFGCSHFQNLFGIFFNAVLFVMLFIMSYCVGICIMNCQSVGDQTIVIRNGKEMKASEGNSSFSFTQYIKTMTPSFLLLYLDQTIIQTTISLSRLAIVNTFGLFILIPILIIIICIIRHHFKIINHQSQTTLAYRAKHSYFYYYDEFYHLHYIDHIFEREHLNKDNETLKVPYYPQSNLIIIQTIFKIFLAASTIVFYEYEPYLFAYCCIFILVGFFFFRKVFYTYQTGDLYFYLGLICVYCFAISTFYFSKFFSYFLIISVYTLEIVALVYFFITIYSWRNEKQGQMFKKVFDRANQSESEDIQVNQPSGQNSQEQIFTKNQKQTNKQLLDNQSLLQQKVSTKQRLVRPYEDKNISVNKDKIDENLKKQQLQPKKIPSTQNLSFVTRQKRLSKNSILSINQIQNNKNQQDKSLIEQIKFEETNNAQNKKIQTIKSQANSIRESLNNKDKKEENKTLRTVNKQGSIQDNKNLFSRKGDQSKIGKDQAQDEKNEDIKKGEQNKSNKDVVSKHFQESIKSNIFKKLKNEQTQINLI